MKYDPTKTKVIIRGFESQLRVLINNFRKIAFPQLLNSFKKNRPYVQNANTLRGQKKQQRSAISEINDILDTVELQEIHTQLPPILQRYARRTYMMGVRKAVQELNKIQIEIDFFLNPRDYEAIGVMIDHNFAEIKNTTTFMKKELTRVLSTGILEGQSMLDMTKAMRERVEISKNNAMRIVRTETIRNYNQASINKYRQTGIKKWRWMTALDEKTCQICEPLDNKVFPIGSEQPPIHPNCRCAVAPVVE